MNQLEQIRIEKHKDFLRKTWLPKFFEKYKSLFDSEIKAQRMISKAIRKHYLPDVANHEFLEFIPGIFRMRIKLTSDNLVKPKQLVEEKDVESDSSEDFTVTKKQKSKKPEKDKKNKKNKNKDDIDQVIEESLKEYNEQFENQMDAVLNESIKDNNDVDYEEYILNQAIMESLGQNNNIFDDSIKQSNDNHQFIQEEEQMNNNSDCLCLVLDIRDFHANPEQPLLINDVPYYLSTDQINRLMKLWNKVNPDTPAGMKFQQDLEYQKAVVHDKKIYL